MPPMVRLEGNDGQDELALVIMSLENPIVSVFLKCHCVGSVELGCTLKAIFDIEALAEAKTMVHKLSAMRDVRFHKISYDFVEPGNFEHLLCTGLANVTDQARDVMARRREERARKRAAAEAAGRGTPADAPPGADAAAWAVMRGLGRGTSRRAAGQRRRSVSAPPRLPRDASAAASPGVDDARELPPIMMEEAGAGVDDVRELPPIMMEMEDAGAGVGESEGEDFDGEDPAHLLDPEDARELEDLVHAEAAARAEDADMPEWCPEIRFVTRPSDRTRILGKINRLHVGTASERLSVYCRLHQCSFLVPGWEAPQ